MTFTVSHDSGRTTLTLTTGETTKSVRVDTDVYNVLTSTVASSNTQLRDALVSAVGCSRARASAVIERFTPGYSSFCGIALLEGYTVDGARGRFFRAASNGVAEAASMLTRNSNSGTEQDDDQPV
jgi:hypothetical protein